MKNLEIANAKIKKLEARVAQLENYIKNTLKAEVPPATDGAP